MADKRRIIAMNIAKMLHDGDVVNLGVGIPTLVGDYLPKDITVFLHGENGLVGHGAAAEMGDANETKAGYDKWLLDHAGERGDWKKGHKDLCDASGTFTTLLPGASCFDSSMSFAIARGGHLDATVLGGLQVDREGNLANWLVPGGRINGIGGAMDIVSGAKKVIIAMVHTAKNGDFKIVDKCTMSLTALSCVSTVVTELCIIDVKPGNLTVVAMAPGVTAEEVQSKTGTKLNFAENMGVMDIPE